MLCLHPKFDSICKGVNEIKLKVQNEEAFMDMLKYIYSGKCSINSSNYLDLVAVSNEYGIDNLKDSVFEFIVKAKCTVNNVCELLMDSKKGKLALFGSAELQKRCINFISLHTRGVCKSQDFVNLDSEFVLSLLNQEALELQEVDLFSALLRWGQNKIMKEGDNKDIKDVLKDFLPLIRFSTMEGKDLVKVVKPTGLIDPKYYLRVLENLTAPEGYEHKEPIPEVLCRGIENFILDTKPGGNQTLFQLSNKNLTIKKLSGGNTWANAMIYGSIKLTKGVHFWEFKVDSINNDKSGTAVGLTKNNKSLNQYSADMVVGLSGYQYNLTGNSTTSFNNGDRIGVFVSFPKKKVFFFHNGTKMQVEGDLIPGQVYYPCFHVYYVNDQFSLSFPKTKPKV